MKFSRYNNHLEKSHGITHLFLSVTMTFNRMTFFFLVEQRLLYNSTKYYVWTDIRLNLNLNFTFFNTTNTIEFDTIDEQIHTVR